MKKQMIALALILMLAVLAAACGHNTEPTGFTEPTTAVETTTELAEEPTSQASDGESTERAEEASPSAPVTTARNITTSTRTARSSTTARPSAASQTTHTVKSQTTTRTTAKMQTTTTTTKATTTSQRTTTTKRTTTTNGAFDINEYIAYGIEYGEGIGYRYIPGADESWDTPIAAYPAIPDEYIKDSIRSRLDFYKKTEPDVTAFNIWAEKQPDGTYDIYIARG